MENAKIGEIYKVKGTDGSAVYVEVEEAPEWAKPKLDEIYICTRSPYSSGFCQIESAGVIKKSELKPLSTKQDRETLKRIKKVEEENKRKTAMHFYAVETPDGLTHVQNSVMGMSGQHHVHDKASFERWSGNIEREFLHMSKAPSCHCGLTRSGDVTEYDGRTWHNDKFE